MNKLIVVAVIVVIVGSVGILFVPDILNQNLSNENTDPNLLKVEDAYWLGDDGLFYFEVYNPTDRFIDGVTIRVDIDGFLDVYSPYWTQSVWTCQGKRDNQVNFSPNETVLFQTPYKFCYFEKLTIIGTSGETYLLEKTFNVEQRGKEYTKLGIEPHPILLENNTILKTILDVRNYGTSNIKIAEIYKNGGLIENATYSFPNKIVPVNARMSITFLQPAPIPTKNDPAPNIGGRFEVITSEGVSIECSLSQNMKYTKTW
jgi:hypothetical protein